jgi:hypothetical protein
MRWTAQYWHETTSVTKLSTSEFSCTEAFMGSDYNSPSTYTFTLASNCECVSAATVRKEVQQRCDEDAACLGLMTLRDAGSCAGFTKYVCEHYYVGCGGIIAISESPDWDTTVSATAVPQQDPLMVQFMNAQPGQVLQLEARIYPWGRTRGYPGIDFPAAAHGSTVTLVGAGREGTVLDAQGQSPFFDIAGHIVGQVFQNPSTLHLRDLTLANGWSSSGGSSDRASSAISVAIASASSQTILMMTNCAVRNSKGGKAPVVLTGVGINYNAAQATTFLAQNVIFEGNTGDQAGAIHVSNGVHGVRLQFDGCTFVKNTGGGANTPAAVRDPSGR